MIDPEKDIAFARPYYREIAERLLNGERLSVICEDINAPFDKMRELVYTGEFQALLKRLEIDRQNLETINIEQQVKEKLEHLKVIALNKTEHLMYSGKSELVQLRAAESILDRCGGSVSKKTDMNVVHTFDKHELTDDELRVEVLRRIEKLADGNKPALPSGGAVEFDTVEVEYERTG